MASQIVTIGLAFGETGKILRLRLHMPTVSGPTGYPRRHSYSYLLTKTRPERLFRSFLHVASGSPDFPPR